MRGALLLLPSAAVLLHSAISAAQEEGEDMRTRRNLRRVSLDPKTVELKSDVVETTTYNPSLDDETFLAKLKHVPPSIVHSRPVAEEDVKVDVLSIGSDTRFEYMPAQLETWAAAPSVRNFYGFTEKQDFDPNCSSFMDDEAARNAYINVCRSPKLGTKAYGVGHGKSGGWFCAQRRHGRALGWLQAVYGTRGGGTVSSLPDILIIVDDDTSVDVGKVERIISEHQNEGPYAAAGGVFQLGKYGGFKAAHGGFGTYFNRAAVEQLTRPLRCDVGADAHAAMCTKLRENRAGELDVYRPEDSIFDVFFKLASRPYFCMHSDWMMGYMITNYAGADLVQVDPPGKRGYCGDESINCHYQNPALMREFAMKHPQRHQRKLSAILDPKTVELKSDAVVEVQMQQPQSLENLDILESLKLTERIWLRGQYAMPQRKKGRGMSNYWGMEEQVAAAQAQWETEHESNHEIPCDLSICGRATNQAIMRYPLADTPCPGFDQEKPMLLLEGSSARGRTGNNLIEFLHAVQIARDQGIQLGATSVSWAVKLVSSLWYVTIEDTPESQAERLNALETAFCMKIFHTEEELEGWTDIIHMSTGDLFSYRSPTPMVEYIPSQLDIFRRLFSHHNVGSGVDSLGQPIPNMCSGLESFFPTLEGRSSAVYTAIHSRNLEGDAGLRIMGKMNRSAGVHPTAALEMRPEYIKAILGPLGMLDHPIVFISDGEDPAVLERLMADPEIGPMMRVLDRAHTSLAGDLAMAIMSDVFIGNPVSSFSSFIGKARMAFGKGHNELWWGVDRKKKWRPVCGDHCLFDYGISGAQA